MLTIGQLKCSLATYFLGPSQLGGKRVARASK
jgi:hypothetical protein